MCYMFGISVAHNGIIVGLGWDDDDDTEDGYENREE